MIIITHLIDNNSAIRINANSHKLTHSITMCDTPFFSSTFKIIVNRSKVMIFSLWANTKLSHPIMMMIQHYNPTKNAIFYAQHMKWSCICLKSLNTDFFLRKFAARLCFGIKLQFRHHYSLPRVLHMIKST